MTLTSAITRRRFLQSSATVVAGAALASSLAQAADSAAKPAGRDFKISLAQWSLHRAIFGKKIDQLEFAAIAKKFDVEGLEYVNQFFKDKGNDQAYLAQMKQRADDQGLRSVLIMCDGEGRLGDPDAKLRKQAVENHHKWVEAAKFLGCHSVRVNAQSEGKYDEQIKLAADGLRQLTEFAKPLGLNVIVENHGGLSSNGAWLASVMKTVNLPTCGTLPDFGNFNISPTEEYDRYQGVAEMMPFAKGVSAKTHDFDAKGNETHTDYGRMMKIVFDAGYHGFVGAEYEGESLPEMEGIAKTIALLRRVRAGEQV